MTDIVDLDVFTAEPRLLRFEGRDITVNQPSTIDYIQMGFLADKLSRDEGLTDQEVAETLDRLLRRFYKLIPELNGHPLNKSQIAVLIAMFTEMILPKSAIELEAKGITKGDDSGKDPSN